MALLSLFIIGVLIGMSLMGLYNIYRKTNPADCIVYKVKGCTKCTEEYTCTYPDCDLIEKYIVSLKEKTDETTRTN